MSKSSHSSTGWSGGKWTEKNEDNIYVNNDYEYHEHQRYIQDHGDEEVKVCYVKEPLIGDYEGDKYLHHARIDTYNESDHDRKLTFEWNRGGFKTTFDKEEGFEEEWSDKKYKLSEINDTAIAASGEKYKIGSNDCQTFAHKVYKK